MAQGVEDHLLAGIGDFVIETQIGYGAGEAAGNAPATLASPASRDDQFSFGLALVPMFEHGFDFSG